MSYDHYVPKFFLRAWRYGMEDGRVRRYGKKVVHDGKPGGLNRIETLSPLAGVGEICGHPDLNKVDWSEVGNLEKTITEPLDHAASRVFLRLRHRHPNPAHKHGGKGQTPPACINTLPQEDVQTVWKFLVFLSIRHPSGLNREQTFLARMKASMRPWPELNDNDREIASQAGKVQMAMVDIAHRYSLRRKHDIRQFNLRSDLLLTSDNPAPNFTGTDCSFVAISPRVLLVAGAPSFLALAEEMSDLQLAEVANVSALHFAKTAIANREFDEEFIWANLGAGLPSESRYEPWQMPKTASRIPEKTGEQHVADIRRERRGDEARFEAWAVAHPVEADAIRRGDAEYLNGLHAPERDRTRMRE